MCKVRLKILFANVNIMLLDIMYLPKSLKRLTTDLCLRVKYLQAIKNMLTLITSR